MLGLAIITSVVSLVSVALKSVATLSVFITKFWLVAGEVCSMLVKIMYIRMYLSTVIQYKISPFLIVPNYFDLPHSIGYLQLMQHPVKDGSIDKIILYLGMYVASNLIKYLRIKKTTNMYTYT